MYNVCCFVVCYLFYSVFYTLMCTNVYIHIHNYTHILSYDDVDKYVCGSVSARTVRYDPLYCSTIRIDFTTENVQMYI
jgi:hypothetical protein